LAADSAVMVSPVALAGLAGSLAQNGRVEQGISGWPLRPCNRAVPYA
jgi:hypothetical protein